MITINNLTYSYLQGARALSGISLNLNKGGVYGLLGENGVGKTTLLSLIAGLLKPREGVVEVSYGDEKTHKPFKGDAEFLQNIYYLPEHVSAPNLKLSKFKELYSSMYPNFSHDDFDTYVELFKVEMDGVMQKMSFGQRKKALLAFALACNTKVLLLDEPTIGLDIPSKTAFRKAINMAADAEKCIVISSHQIRELENVINPIIIMQRRQVIMNCTAEELSEKLWFGVVDSLSDENGKILYSEECIGGYQVIRRNLHGEQTKIDLETLFNAVVSNVDVFKAVLNYEL